MKKLLVFLSIFFPAITVIAQPNIEWQKSLGGSDNEFSYCIEQSADGGYIIVGATFSSDGNFISNHGNSDAYIVKISSTGVIEWQKILGGSSFDLGYTIHQTRDGGYIMGGETSSNDGDVSGNHGNLDFWVVKLTSTGDIQWQKTFGGSKADRGLSIQQTSDDGYILAGETESYDGDVLLNHGKLDFWIVKLSEAGIIQWQKSLGGSEYEYAPTIQQTNDGGYIVAGASNSINGDVFDNHGDKDFWMVKLSATGSIEWKKTLGGYDFEFNPFIRQTNDGGYIVAGQSYSFDQWVLDNHGASDFWVVKLTHSGTIQWQSSLGGSGNDVAFAIQQTNEGGYIVAGLTSSSDGDVSNFHGEGDFWVVKLSESGVKQWQKALGGNSIDIPYYVQQTSEGGYIIAGYSYSSNGDLTVNNGLSDAWIVKLSPVVGVEDIPTTTQSKALAVFPCPSNGVISLLASSEEFTLSVRITDFQGRQIRQQPLLNGAELDVSLLPNGVYSVVATTLLGEVFSNTFNIQK